MSKKLGEMLVQEQLITPQQLQQALEQQQGGKGFLGHILVESGALDETRLVEALSRQPGVGRIDVRRLKPDPTLVKAIPEDLARKRGVLPIQLDGNMLQVGMVDPLDDKTIDLLGEQTGHVIQPAVIPPGNWEQAFGLVYNGKTGKKKDKKQDAGDEGEAKIPSAAEMDKVVEHSVQEISDLDIVRDAVSDDSEAIPADIDPGTPPIIRLSNTILLKCIQTDASDIHMEPQEESVRVRYRIDGTLHTLFTLPKALKNALTSRFKIMSDMDVAEHRIPQDGRINLDLGGGKTIDFRINTLPGVQGEKLVARILGTGMLKDRVAELGFTPENLEHAENALHSHFGMILVTGPTGSGKTTTLYTMLNQMNTEDVNIVTAEDPVEYNLPGIHQVNIRAAIGFTFDTALRSFLRQDPDIILVGEMRDYETAAIAVKAALTGHLVLSTLHTNDAPSTVVRLIDMGIEPYLVASAVKLVIAQRLARKICQNCKEEVPMGEIQKLDLPTEVMDMIETASRGRGCNICNGIGNKGRLPLFEVMPIKSRELRRVITEGGTEIQVSQVAKKEGLVVLSENAIQQLNNGIINLDEAIKVVLSD